MKKGIMSKETTPTNKRPIETIEDLQDAITELQLFLRNPQPGLSVWVEMLAIKMDRICNWWEGR
jgi:hypothetical protein